MEERSIHSYFGFGTCVRFLQDAKAGWAVGGVGDGLLVAHNLQEFLDEIDRLKLRVTSHLAQTNSLREMSAELSQRDAGAVLTDGDAKRLEATMTDVRHTLEAELLTSMAFIVSDKRWDVAKLLNDMGGLFAPDVFAELPDIARIDFQEAGRCIAFERSTASAFHLLRGTESVLRQFYLHTVRQGRLRETQRTWGSMVQQMRSRRRPPSLTLLDNLDNIRRNYRNPTQHPELVYDVQGAQDLLGLCIDVVNHMHRDT